MYSRNPIVSGYPDYIEVNGKRYTIETGFRYWLQISRCLDDNTQTEEQKIAAILRLSKVEDASVDIVHALISFAAQNASKSPREPIARTFDWDVDAGAIIASFYQQYRIDLTSIDTQMHWWLFLDLFAGLGDNTAIMRTIEVRTMDTPTGNDAVSRKQADAIRKAKKRLALPAKTRADFEQKERELWGD